MSETTEHEAATQQQVPHERVVMRQIANIAHHGGLIGLGDLHDAMKEIRKLTLPYWDKEECSRLQRKIGA